ncbi:MAG: hypothetical protein JSW71_13070 [Gemmatimonadota bacterium]|nr:MAG: hypothetical protein JSW71_13070 [Gemmatimonadota bacterium]
MSILDSQRAEFLTSVITDVAHELRNVLAIVMETVGLVDDLMTLSHPNSLDREKIKSLASRVGPQADRAAELAAVLHQLVQAYQDPSPSTSLNLVTERVAVMCQRRARKKRVSVQVTPCDQDVQVLGEQLTVYMMIHAAMECYLELLPESSVLSIQASAVPDFASVDLAGSLQGIAVKLDPTQSAAWNTVDNAAADVGASLQAESTGRSLRIAFASTDVEWGSRS